MQILAWLCEDSCSAVLRFACANALAALAGDGTDVGLGIARAWLGDLMVHLTRNVKAHHSIRQVKHCYAKVEQVLFAVKVCDDFYFMPCPGATGMPAVFSRFAPWQ